MKHSLNANIFVHNWKQHKMMAFFKMKLYNKISTQRNSDYTLHQKYFKIFCLGKTFNKTILMNSLMFIFCVFFVVVACVNSPLTFTYFSEFDISIIVQWMILCASYTITNTL